MKLNIGGEDIEDYFGVDICPLTNEKLVTYSGINFEERGSLLCFNEVEDVISLHSLEHLYLKDAWRVLTEILSILRLYGRLRIQVPNAMCTIEQNAGHEYPLFHHIELDHRMLYTPELFKRMLEEVGFKNVKIMEKPEYGKEGTVNWYFRRKFNESITLEAYK